MTEEERLRALASYSVLDTPAEAAFDDLTKLAADLCDVPIALVSLVDHDRQWFKSRVGLDPRQTPRAISFCAHAIEHEDTFIVNDARHDPRFESNPLVTGNPFIQFYAGVPLYDHENAALGTLCVIDSRPRELTPLQLETLRVLAKQVVTQLELRRALTTETVLRNQVERASARASFLADAGKLLAASLDAEHTLAAVGRLAVPLVADVCSIMICDEEGRLRRLGETGADADAAAQMRALREHADTRDAPLAMQHAIAEKRPVLFADYPAWLQSRLPAGHPYLDVVTKLGVVDAISAPMMLGGRVLGALSVATQRSSGKRFDAHDLVTTGELAQRSAVAIENARLFGEATRERARAEQANRTKDAFLAAVSHDLRTPLSAILGWSQMIKGDSDPELRKRAMEVIERSARSQSRLIEDLLDVSSIVAGQLHVEREPINLVAVVESALETLAPTAEARGVIIEQLLDPEAMQGVGDFGRLQQVVWNLASNAIKFSNKGGRIAVRLERAGEHATLTVRDDGRGIPPALMPTIFERFRQDDGGVGRRLGGLGLGLAIAKHIVEAVGGTIRAQSDGEGRGASFIVTLPLSHESSVHPPALAIHGGTAVPFDSAALRGARVLVVDHDHDTRVALSELLGAHGVHVSTAGSAEEAFPAFRRERPDLLVSEVMMGGESGYDLVRRVRDLSPQDGGRTPALALTTSATGADRARALAAGFHFYVPKPIEPTELLAVIAALVTREKPSSSRGRS